MTQLVNNPPAMQKTWVRSLGQEDPLEKEMATHSSILVWKSHGQRSLAGYSPWGHRLTQFSDYTATTPTCGYITELHCGTLETNTTLLFKHPPI